MSEPARPPIVVGVDGSDHSVEALCQAKTIADALDADAGLLLGSVSAECAEHATCPVPVVHGRAA